MEERERKQTMKENKKNGTVEVDVIDGWSYVKGRAWL